MAEPRLQGNESPEFRGDIHWFPPGEEGMHEASALCGCNPDWHGAQDHTDDSGWVHFRFGSEEPS